MRLRRFLCRRGLRYEQFADAFNFSNSSQFSVAWWAKAPSGSSGHYFIKGTSVADKGIGDWSITHSADGNIYFSNQDNSWLVSFRETRGAWVYLTFTYSGGLIKYYENGALVGSGTGTFSAASGKPLLVGGLPGYGAGEANAFMADVAIWATALGAADVASLASGVSLPTAYPNLRAWWKMDEGSGTTSTDWSSSASDLQLSAAAPWSMSECP